MGASAGIAAPDERPSRLAPGGRHCAITYRARISSAVTWTAVVTVAGQLITHASDKNGNVYRRVVYLNPGRHVFAAPVPLSRINDIGGVLHTTGTSRWEPA